MDHDPRPVGKRELADLLGVNRGTPQLWKQRGLLPPADWPSVNGSEAWALDTVLVWAARTGRLESLPPNLRPRARRLAAEANRQER